jgi:hypothetical protein
MKSMQPKKLAVISTLIALVGIMFVPAVAAHPINANLSWSPNVVTTPGTSTTATYGVNDVLPSSSTPDPDCPSGDTFTGTLTVTEAAPSSGVSTVTVGTTPCGTTSLTSVYPTAFTGVASTTECGLYSAVWSGVTSATVGGVHPTFSVTDNFVVEGCSTSTVPQFTAPLMLVAAFGLVLMAAAKKGRLLKV